METSLAEDVQEKTQTLSPQSFFFMSPYRSFSTSGCFQPLFPARPSAAMRQIPRVPAGFGGSAFAAARAAGIAQAGDGRRDPVRHHAAFRAAIFPNAGRRLSRTDKTAVRALSRRRVEATGASSARQEIPEQAECSSAMVERARRS